MSILDHFPLDSPRPQQADVLRQIEEKWNTHDIFVVDSPVGSGKSAIAATIASWQKSKTTILVPNNLLLEQYLKDYPELATVKKQASYECPTYQTTCDKVKKIKKGFCKGCTYQCALSNTRSSNSRVVNYYTYMAHKLHSTVAIFDEAHLLIDTLQNTNAIKIWYNEHQFPEGLRTTADVVGWIENQPACPKLKKAKHEILKFRRKAVVTNTNEWYRGSQTTCLVIKPLTVADCPPMLWPPSKTKKLVLMSGTINAKDISELGLGRGGKKVAIIKAESPIPSSQRPVIALPAAYMNHGAMDLAAKKAAEAVIKLAEQHPEKGIIHAPYSMISSLRNYLKGARFLWHDRANKKQVFAKFQHSGTEDRRVLVASGMYEGIDLKYDSARWQAILKVPFLSLGSEAIRAKAEEDPLWYAWEATKKVLQATGRVCRAPDDYGVTYILDANLNRLLDKHKSLFPPHFLESLTRKDSI